MQAGSAKKNFYHVTPEWDGNDLVPLEDEDEFLRRWPESGELKQYHAYVVHMYDSLDAARDHLSDLGQGEILVIDPEEIEWTLDTLEPHLPHPVAYEVPKRAISRLLTTEIFS